MEAHKYIQLAKKRIEELKALIENGFVIIKPAQEQEDRPKKECLEEIRNEETPQELIDLIEEKDREIIAAAEKKREQAKQYFAYVLLIIVGLFLLWITMANTKIPKGWTVSDARAFEYAMIFLSLFFVIIAVNIGFTALNLWKETTKRYITGEQNNVYINMHERYCEMIYRERRAAGAYKITVETQEYKDSLDYMEEAGFNADIPHVWKFFFTWLIMEMENLNRYIETLAEATEGKEGSLTIGVFEPNYNEAQTTIAKQARYLDIDQLFTILARAVAFERDEDILKKKTKIADVKERFLRSVDKSTAQMDTPTKEDTESFFLPRFRALVPYHARQRHTYIMGASGSGKSELIKLFVYNDIQHGSGTLIIDPHNELSLEISAFDVFAKDPDKLVFIHPKPSEVIYRLKLHEDIKQTYTPQYNPLEYRYHHIKKESEILERIKGRATGLTDALQIATQTSFTPQMVNLIASCLEVLLYHEGMKISDLMHFMDDDKNSKYLRLARKHPDKQLRGFFSDGGDFLKKNYATTKDGIRARIYGLLTRGNLAKIIDCEKSSFDIPKLLQEGKTIVVNLHPSYLEERGQKALGALLVSDVTMWGYSRNTERAKGVFVYIDEVQNFITPTIVKALAQIRKFGIHFVLANQGLFQFDTDDQATKKTIVKGAVLTNTQVKFVGLTDHPSEAREMTKATGGAVDIEKAKLGTGKWVMRVQKRDSQIIHADSFLVAGASSLGVLGKENYMTEETYKKAFVQQLKDYYHTTNAPTSSDTEKKQTQAPQEPKKGARRQRPPKYDKM